MKKLTLTLALVLILMLACIGGAYAQNVSFTDLGYTGPQTVQIYDSNGTLRGTWNTTSNGIPLPAGDFTILVKPTVWNQDLGQTLTMALAWLAQYWYVLLFVGFVLLVVRKK